jgi:hypothetical protein
MLTLAWMQGGEWCLPKVGGLSMGGDSAPTKETLDQMCDPCTMRYMRIMMRVFMLMAEGMAGESSSSGSGDPDMSKMMSAMMAAMCSKDTDDTYCMLKPAFQSMMGGGDDSSDDSSGPPASAMCSLCGKKIMQAMAKAGTWLLDFRLSPEFY